MQKEEGSCAGGIRETRLAGSTALAADLFPLLFIGFDLAITDGTPEFCVILFVLIGVGDGEGRERLIERAAFA